jgi:hypothetical protein
MTLARVLVALSAAVLTIVATPARARGPADKKRQPPRKVLRLDELKVEGRIHKPQAMFLMPRANLDPRDLDRPRPLLPKVTRAVEKDPF